MLATLAGAPMVRGQSITPSIINNMGGSGTIAGNTYEWSVGEIMVSTFSAPSVIVTQGVLQPMSSTSDVPMSPVLSGINVFPNPASSAVNIQFNTQQEGTFTYRLMDVAGRVILENSSTVQPGTVTKQFDISKLANANYMLQVFLRPQDGPEATNTFKVQKLN
ncbi:hypothetical protein GCM10023093_01580 [Nemorincola caseinilytica]|uniref:Secretion system C-terminal sorting domain-containing protein n=2 Tax=Nemorincola caseinilytica TaxID=2054315 RepID=A0ABP8N1V4_9BACT